MTLYEINADMEQAFNAAVDPETGEIIDEAMAERFEALSLDRDTKIENIAVFIKNLRAEAAAIKAEKDNLYKRQKAAENKAESLTRYLSMALNGEKFKSARASVSWRRSEAVQIDDISALPAEYVTMTPTANKADIKAAIKAGHEIAGASIVENQSMIIK